MSAAEVVADSLARNGATIRNERGYDAELGHLGVLWYSWRSLQVRDAAAREGGTLRFTMELSRASEAPVSVDYETADGTATAGRDYTAKRGTVTFGPGHTRRTVEVPVLRDGEAEDAETVVLRLSDARSEGSEAPVEVTAGEAEGTIEDVAPEAPSGGLTASFAGVPAAHDGKAAFRLRIAFSEPVSWMNGRRLREEVVAVSGGRATSAGRVDRRRDLWQLTVEPDSRAGVTVTLAAGAACGTPAAVCTKDGRALSETISTVVRGPVTVSVADARVREAPGAMLDFAVTLSGPASGPVTVAYRTVDGSARAGRGLHGAAGQADLRSGRDGEDGAGGGAGTTPHDEGEEKMALVLYRSSGAIRDDYLGVGTIENADYMPSAWLARFGRTVTDQVLDAVEERLAAPRRPGAQATLAGQALSSWDGSGKAAANDNAADPGSGSGAGDDATAANDNASERALAARDRDAMTAIRDWMAHAGSEPRPDRRRSGGPRAVVRADRRLGRGGRVCGAVGPGRDLALRRARGRAHARRRGDDRADRRGLGVGARVAALDGGSGGGPRAGHGQLPRGRRLRRQQRRHRR